MRALLHVHSNYSYDGEGSLEELAAWGATRGLDAIFLSEHTNDFDSVKMGRFVAHCDRLATTGCRLVPGLELPVRGGFHLLGYNVRAFEPILDPAQAARFIREQGGLAVLAHPARYAGSWPGEDALAEMDGIEAWNARYDGRFIPSGALLREIARRAPAGGALRVFGGQDLHALTPNRLVCTDSKAASLAELLAALRSGETTFGAAPFRYCSSGAHPLVGRIAATALHATYRRARAMRTRLRKRTVRI